MEHPTEFEKLREIHQEMKERATASKNKIFTLQKEFMVSPEVFYPPQEHLTHLINASIYNLATREIAKKSQQESIDFLEVGCGAGYVAISVALSSNKCHVWATDINEAAVENAEANAKLHGVENRFHVVHANVFDHEEIAGRKFDMIYWNHPWGGHSTEAGTKVEPMMRGILDPDYHGLRDYFSKAENYLKNSGRLLIAFSFTVGSEKRFTEIASENGWSYKVIEKMQENDTEMLIELVKEMK